MKSFEDLQDVRKEIVASFAEAWIEIANASANASCAFSSPPSRRRGLKLLTRICNMRTTIVASFAEAWIEITGFRLVKTLLPVASFAEAWIEIIRNMDYTLTCRRLLRGGVA